jgi:hypothetical protein
MVSVIVAGERRYRDGVLRSHIWRIQQSTNLIQQMRNEQEDAVRIERERQIEWERQRVGRLLSKSDAFVRRAKSEIT